MSEAADEIEAEIQKDLLADERKKAIDEKGLVIREHNVTRQYNELIQNKAEIEEAKNVRFGALSATSVENLVKDSDEYLEAAKKPMLFINETFKKMVPYFRKNLILVGGDTGDGKSTAVANIIYSTMSKNNPATGKPARVLVLSNEEKPEDFYNRVTCLMNEWRYVNHDEFTDEQRRTFREFLPELAKDGKLTIIGDYHEGISGWTTTVEGIEQIFNSMIQHGDFYDAVIIDYYQNVNRSKNDPKLDEFMCQRKFANFLDQMKLIYPGPIVVMAQMKKLADEDDSTPFNVRLKGSKLICDKATLITEIIPEREYLRSKWKIHKGRFTDSVGQSMYTGFYKGKFVPYNEDFQRKVSSIVAKNLDKIAEDKRGLSGKEDETSEMERAENEKK